jgi:hypothetical protein
MRTARWVVVALTFLSASVAVAQDAPKGDDFEKLSSAIKFGGEPSLKATLDAGANPKAANASTSNATRLGRTIGVHSNGEVTMLGPPPLGRHRWIA